MDEKIQFKNRLKEIRVEKKISQGSLAEMVGVSRNTISSIETGQYSPTAKLAYSLCIALDKKFEEVFYFEGITVRKDVEDTLYSEREEYESALPDSKIQKIFEYLSKEGWDSSKMLDFLLYLTK